MSSLPSVSNRPANGGISGMRLRGLMRKEFLQILRDPSSIAIAFVLPLVLLLLFGYGVSLDAKHVPIALVVEKQDAATASFTGAFRKLEYFAPRNYADMPAAETAMLEGEVNAILHLTGDFGQRIHRPEGAPAQPRRRCPVGRYRFGDAGGFRPGEAMTGLPGADEEIVVLAARP